MPFFNTYIIGIGNVIQNGGALDETKAFIIISDEYDELGSAINKRLGRNSTNLKAFITIMPVQEAHGGPFKSPIH